MQFPENDTMYEEFTITKARPHWITHSGGTTYWMPAERPGKPEDVGETARFYVGAHGSVRGLFINGQKVFYRTERENCSDPFDHGRFLDGEEGLGVIDGQAGELLCSTICEGGRRWEIKTRDLIGPVLEAEELELLSDAFSNLALCAEAMVASIRARKGGRLEVALRQDRLFNEAYAKLPTWAKW